MYFLLHSHCTDARIALAPATAWMVCIYDPGLALMISGGAITDVVFLLYLKVVGYGHEGRFLR